MLVDQSLGFCVVDFMFVAKMPPAEQRYFVYRGNQQVGEIVTTSQTDETFLVADINKGTSVRATLFAPNSTDGWRDPGNLGALSFYCSAGSGAGDCGFFLWGEWRLK